MSRLKWCAPPLAAACLLVLALAGTFWAQDKKSPADKHDGRALRDSLKDVINNGAELFNRFDDHAGCYRMFQGALLSVKPFLTPALQKEIDDSLAAAERQSRFSDKAFTLRKTIDNIRAQAGQAPPVNTDKKPQDKAPPGEKIDKPPSKDVRKTDAPKEKTETPKTTLWDRLGGEANVRKVVEDFAKAAAADPKVNLSRDGKFKLDEPTVKLLEDHLVDFVSSASGGPLKYTGKNMKDAHKGMGITNAEFDAAGKHLKKALETNGAKAEDAAEVLKAIESLRKDIVAKKKKDTPKTDEPKKDDVKKDTPKADAPKKDEPKKVDEKKDEPKKAAPPAVKNNEETAKISGKVTFDGKAAPTGYFTLVSGDKRRYSTAIKRDGSYSFRTAIPAGTYLVAIEQAFGEKAPQPDIPRRFRSEETSGLTFEVRAGAQVFDVDLK